jgi:hypothetical protein
MYGSGLNIGWFRGSDGIFHLLEETSEQLEVSLGFSGILVG